MQKVLNRLLCDRRETYCRVAFLITKNITDAEDVVQNVHLKILTSDNFPQDIPPFAYLYSMVINTAKNFVIKNHKDIPLAEIDITQFPYEDKDFERMMYRDMIKALLLSVPPKYRPALYDYFIDDRSISYLSLKYHYSRNTLKKWIDYLIEKADFFD